MLGLIDESTPESARGVHYVIGAAVLIDPDRRDEARERARKLIGARCRPFHWRDEGIGQRLAMIDLVGELELGVFAVVHHPVAPKRQRHARSRSLIALAPMLCREGVEELIIESRGTQDVEDRQTLLDGITDGIIPPQMHYDFASKDDALMWLPDAIAGVISEAERRKSDRWLVELQRQAAALDVRRC